MTFAPFWRDVGLREGTFANARTKDPWQDIDASGALDLKSQTGSRPMGSERQIRSRRLH
jgi:hypothetical protein